MADIKISDMTAASDLTGAVIPIVQGGVNKKADSTLFGGGGTWGSITGTLSSQTDLQTALDGKVNDTGNETIAGVKTFSSDPIIPDEPYGAGWDASLEPPTKNAVYDKIENISSTFWTLASGGTLTGNNTIAAGSNTLTFTGSPTAGTATAIQITNTLTGTASTGETLIGLDINSTFSGTTTSDSLYVLRLRNNGTDVFSASSAGSSFFGAATAPCQISPTAGTQTVSASGGSMLIRTGTPWQGASRTGMIFVTRENSSNSAGQGAFLFTANSGNDTWVVNSGTSTFKFMSISPVWNIGGGTNTIIGFEYNPTETAITGVTHYGILQRSTSALSGIGTATPTALLHIAAVTTSRSSIRIEAGSTTTAPSSPNAGDIWHQGTNNRLMYRKGSSSEELMSTVQVNSISPTSPNRTIQITIDGTTYYIHAKTTND